MMTHHAGELRERLVDYVQDALAMEQNSLMMLKSMLSHTHDPELRELLEHHVSETQRHEERLRSRLEGLGESTSKTKQSGALVGSMFKGVLDQVRSEKPSKDARDGYPTEQLEIASYELLQRLAERAGDGETAELARLNLRDEKAMADKISQSWDKVIDLTLKEEGLHP
jgi:ferritin-like metal-binding protein YciE